MTTRAGANLKPAGLALALAIAMLLSSGCARVTETLELTGNVAAVPPQPIGAERLYVALPETGARATLAPVSRRDGVTVWQTLDGITLSLREGLLVATRGLGDDLMSADVSGQLSVLRMAGNDDYRPHIRSYLDGDDQTVFRGYQCRRISRVKTTLRIEGSARAARRVEVQCTAPTRTFTNLYWIDATGAVLKSRQWISPTMQYMETQRVMR